MKSIFQCWLIGLVLLSFSVQAEFLESWSQEKALSKIESGDTVFLDVRSRSEFMAGHVPGAINIPHDEVLARIDEIKVLMDKNVVVYCHSGRRAQIAETALSNEGVAGLFHLQGDMSGWRASGLPVEK